MCELFGLSSRTPTAVAFSLERFAQRGGLHGRTLDGWGLAFYDGSDIRLFREPEPARTASGCRSSSSGACRAHSWYRTFGTPHKAASPFPTRNPSRAN